MLNPYKYKQVKQISQLESSLKILHLSHAPGTPKLEQVGLVKLDPFLNSELSWLLVLTTLFHNFKCIALIIWIVPVDELVKARNNFLIVTILFESAIIFCEQIY